MFGTVTEGIEYIHLIEGYGEPKTGNVKHKIEIRDCGESKPKPRYRDRVTILKETDCSESDMVHDSIEYLTEDSERYMKQIMEESTDAHRTRIGDSEEDYVYRGHRPWEDVEIKKYERLLKVESKEEIK